MDKLINLYYPEFNLPLAERLDPFITSAFSFLNPSAHGLYYVAMQYVIVILGVFAFSIQLYRCQRHAIASSFLVTLALYGFYGGEALANYTHYFPLLLASWLLLLKKGTLLSLLLAFLTTAVWNITAGPLAVVGALFAAGSVLGIALLQNHGGASSNLRTRELFVLLVTSIVLGIWLMPIYSMPAYPSGARLSPISYATFLPPPLLSPVLDPNPILFEPILSTSVNYAWRSVSIGLIVVLASFFTAASPRVRWFGMAIMICSILFVSLDLLLEPNFVEISPLFFLQRVVPGYALKPFPWELLHLAFLIAIPLTLGEIRSARASFGLLLSSFVVFALFVVNLNCFHGLIGRESQFNLKLIRSSDIAVPLIDRARFSPSGFVVQAYGDWSVDPKLFEERQKRQLVRVEQNRDAMWQANAAPAGHNAKLAIDGKPETKWGTGRAQRENDFYLLGFDKPTSLIKAVLKLPEGGADFPRGIRVEGSLDGEKYWTIVDQPHWYGPLEWNDVGFPYFGLQSQVELDFPTEQVVQYLRFVQIGRDEIYDWSITEVELYRKK